MAKIVRRLGELRGTYTLGDIRSDGEGHLSWMSLQLEGCSHRHEFIDRKLDAVVVLPVDWARRVLYLVRQARPIKALSSADRRAMLRQVAADESNRETLRDLLGREVHTIDAPAGMIELDETPAQAGVREVDEETGFVIQESVLELVASHLTSTGMTNERHVCFLASVDENTPMHDPEGDGAEVIETLEVTFEEAFAMLQARESEHASLNFLLAEVRRRDEVRQKDVIIARLTAENESLKSARDRALEAIAIIEGKLSTC